MAARKPHELVTHGDVRVDDYYWLRDDDRKDPRVLEHLKVDPAGSEAARGCIHSSTLLWWPGLSGYDHQKVRSPAT